eukprot:COSAG02_NODE_37790_length_437_cov_1.076923_1_plen_74_part_01
MNILSFGTWFKKKNHHLIPRRTALLVDLVAHPGVLCECMKPSRHRARGRAAIFFPEKDKKGKFGAIFLVLGLRR